MSQRFGLLFSDGSLLVLPEATDLNTAWREAVEHDSGDPDPRTEVVQIEINMIRRYERSQRTH